LGDYNRRTLLCVINGQQLCKGNPDTWKWKGEVDGIFSVKASYNTLQGIVEIEGNKDFKLL